jgi:hypothetical protein
MDPPQHHEVRSPGRIADDNDGWKDVSFFEQEMVDRDQDLPRIQAELDGDFLDRVEGRSVYIRLAGFAEPTVADWRSESVQQGFERRRTAVHR